MAVIKPFKAIRPKKGLEDKIAALPYDVYSREEAREKVKNDNYTFLRIDRAETQFAEDYDMYAPEVYQKAHDMLWDMIEKGDFVQDDNACYYVYEQVMNQRSQTGIVAASSVDDYLNEIIKKHENTREDKEIDRIKHVDICNAQTGPIFLAYRKNNNIEEVINKAKAGKPVYDFVSDDGITHRVWIVDDKNDVNTIASAFNNINEIYIADGHHRCASAVKVCLKRRKEMAEYTGNEEFNYFLSVLFADEQLMIMDYNRVVKDLNGYTVNELLEKISVDFDIVKLENDDIRPDCKYKVAMYLDNSWYHMSYKGEKSNDPVKKLDVSILQDKVLGPILGIDDPKTDKRIDFVGGIRGIKELERRVQKDCKVAFLMYPTSISELFEVADAGMLMPPKSTWFEPKLRSGLFIHSIK